MASRPRIYYNLQRIVAAITDLTFCTKDRARRIAIFLFKFKKRIFFIKKAKFARPTVGKTESVGSPFLEKIKTKTVPKTIWHFRTPQCARGAVVD